MSTDPSVIDVTDETFERDVITASSTRPVVVDFWADWCAPCRALGPILEAAVVGHGGVTLAKLDVDANPRTSAAFGVQGIPAVKGFRDGRITKEFLGLQPRPVVERFLADLAPAPAAPAAALPSDEVGLVAELVERPDNAAARRALGRLLLDAERLDDAEAVLAEVPQDLVIDGLRARVEMLRESNGMLAALLGSGNEALALHGLIAAIRNSTDPTRSRLRRIAVGIIENERERNPEVEALRAELASALF